MTRTNNRTWILLISILFLTLLSGVGAALPDLNVNAISVNPGGGDNLFAHEPNLIRATIKNFGDEAATPFDVTIEVGLHTETKRRTSNLNAGAQTTITFNGYSPSATGPVTIQVTVDSSGEVIESDEGNNVRESTQTVYYNGYKGKRFTEGNDINTNAGPYEGHINVGYSPGNSAYSGAGWTTKTYNWISSDLPVPDGATIVSARLYQGYTWDQTPGGSPLWTMTFNSTTVTPEATYTDRKSYGGYDLPQGLVVYDVTDEFNPAGNSMTITPLEGNNNAIYGAFLIVVYEHASEKQRQIWINEEMDSLYAGTSRSVSSEEATAYTNFYDVINTDLSSAKAVAILQEANENGKSKFFFNTQEYTGFWPDFEATLGFGFSVYDVTDALKSGDNEARLQSYDAGSGGDNMYATNVILIVEKQDVIPAPEADFSADDTTPDIGQTVNFTDQSANTPTSWAWTIEGTEDVDYQYVDSTLSNSQNPHVQFLVAGTYDVSLTATNDGGDDTETKIGYISVTEPAPVTIEVTLDPIYVSLGTMVADQDATNSTMVNVEASGGSSWSVTAEDGRTTAHTGYMIIATDLNLTNPIQLGKDGSGFQTLDSGAVTFWSDTVMGTFSAMASLKQPVSSSDQVGDYSITITFTGAIS